MKKNVCTFQLLIRRIRFWIINSSLIEAVIFCHKNISCQKSLRQQIRTTHYVGASSDLSDVSYSTRLTSCHPAFSLLQSVTFLPKVYFLNSSFSVDVGVHWSHGMFYFWKALKDLGKRNFLRLNRCLRVISNF